MQIGVKNLVEAEMLQNSKWNSCLNLHPETLQHLLHSCHSQLCCPQVYSEFIILSSHENWKYVLGIFVWICSLQKIIIIKEKIEIKFLILAHCSLKYLFSLVLHNLFYKIIIFKIQKLPSAPNPCLFAFPRRTVHANFSVAFWVTLTSII